MYLKRSLDIIKTPLVILTMIAVVIILGVSASGLLIQSNFSPVYVGVLPFILALLIFWLRKPVWALYAAIFVVFLPLGLLPASLQSYLNRLLAIAALVTWLFDWLVHRRKLVLTASSILMLIFMVWAAFSLLWASSTSLGLRDIQTYLLRFVVFVLLITNEVKIRRDLNVLMRILAINGWIYAGSGLFTIFTQGYQPGSRFQILGENENAVGTTLLLTLAGTIWIAMQASKRWAVFIKPVVFGYIALVLGLTVMSGSRGGAISILVALFIFLFFRSTRIWGFAGIFLILVGLVVAPIIFSTTVERFISYDGTTPLGGREILWDAAWNVILYHPFFGVGVGNSGYAISPYLNMIPSEVIKSPSIHNPILVIWSELGLVGILFYLGILLSALWSFLRIYISHFKQNIELRTIYIPIIFSVVVGYLFSWVKGGGMETAHTFFLAIGLLNLPALIHEGEIANAKLPSKVITSE